MPDDVDTGTDEASNVAAFDVDVAWTAADRCSTRSPAFKVGAIPAGTRTLRFQMTDLDVPSYYHGGGSVAYAGSGQVPAGAFSYQGPCPPTGSHRYEWAVTALDDKSAVVGRGTVVRAYP